CGLGQGLHAATQLTPAPTGTSASAADVRRLPRGFAPGSRGTPSSPDQGDDVNDLGVIDRFLAAFIKYIDSGFGLLGGDVAFLTTALVGIDITLAGLFWSLEPTDNVLGKLLKKILYVGAFALILGSFQTLSEVIFRSFAGLGLTAGGGRL